MFRFSNQHATTVVPCVEDGFPGCDAGVGPLLSPMKDSSDEEDVEAILNGGPTPTATPTPPPPPLKEVNPRKRKDSENTASSKGSKAAANRCGL